MAPSLRRFLVQFHLCAGLAVGGLAVVIALAGAVLIFRPQLERHVYAANFAVSPGATRAPLDLLIENAAKAYPGRSFNFIRFWSAPDQPALIRASNNDQIYLDPWNGRVSGMQNRYHGIFGRAEDIHRFLGLGATWGKQIVGATAVVFALIIMTGLVIWIPPAWRLVRTALTFNRRTRGRARLLGWHRTLGAWAGLLLILSPLTGLALIYDWYKNGVYVLTGSTQATPPELPSADSSMPRLPISELWSRSRQLMPEYESAQIYLPAPGKRVMEIWVVETGAPHPHARSYLYLDAATGGVLRHTPYLESSAGHRLFHWMLAWHLGQAGGLATQILLLIAMLSVPALAVTGIWSRLRRKPAATPVAQKREAVSAPP